MPRPSEASLILDAGKPDDAMPDSGSMGMESAMSDFLDAMDRKDPSGMAKAFTMAFQMADSMPHAEGPHVPEGMDAGQ